MQETWVQSLGQEDSLKKEMVTIPGSGWSLEEGNGAHSSILAWITPWTEEPGGLQSAGLPKSRTWLGHYTTTAKDRNRDFFQSNLCEAKSNGFIKPKTSFQGIWLSLLRNQDDFWKRPKEYGVRYDNCFALNNGSYSGLLGVYYRELMPA